MHVLYFLKILPPSKCCHTVRGRQQSRALYVHTNMKLCTRVRVDLCRHCPRIVAAWYSALKLNLAVARFRGNALAQFLNIVLTNCTPILLEPSSSMVRVRREERFSILVNLFWIKKSFSTQTNPSMLPMLPMWLKDRSRELQCVCVYVCVVRV